MLLSTLLMLTICIGNAWGNTIYLPGGSSTYTRGTWHSIGGAPSTYSTTATSYNISVGDDKYIPVTFYNAADYGTSYETTGWLQLKGSSKSDKGYISLHVISTNTITVTVSYCSNSDATMSIGASNYTLNNGKSGPTVSGAFSTLTKTGSSEFDLTLTAGEGAAYIGTITLTSSGTITTYSACTSRTLSFANSTVTKQVGVNGPAKYQNYSLSNGTSGVDTWSSSNTSVATVNATSGVITLEGAGSTTISVTAAANGDYCAASGSYTLNVIEATATASPTSWNFGNVEVGNTVYKDFTITTANLNSNLDIDLYDGSVGMSVSPASIAKAATSTTVRVTFTPASKGLKEDIVNISGGALPADLDIAVSGTGVLHHAVHWMVNGEDWSLAPAEHGGAAIATVVDGEKPTLPTPPVAGEDGCGDKFMGWTTSPITGSVGSAPTPLWNSQTYFSAVTAEVTYYAVFADENP
ncbi:MAG: hypothetical protein IKO63_07205 [Paludibacteraceae bacterium]|nr:hypothetical protein [Paludibacteraceae bacterium]